MIPAAAHPALRVAAEAARLAYDSARATHDREALAEHVADGADGTPTMLIDMLVEPAILDALERAAPAAGTVNVLSEEAGLVDRGSAVTLVMDPLDGSANAAAGVPLCAFSAAVAVDGAFTEALTVWLDTGRSWWAARDAGAPAPGRGRGASRRTSGRRTLDGAAVSLLRPRTDLTHAWAAWQAVAHRAGRIRILSSSCLEAALVAEGAVDAFADAASDTHRLVDIAAAVVLAEAAGGAVRDVHGRAIEPDTDLTRRWSGVVGATPELADELAETLRTAATAATADA